MKLQLAMAALLPALACRWLAASPVGATSDWLKAQDAALGAGSGVIVLDQPAVIDAPLVLHRGHTLEIRSSVRWNATVRLEGNNTVRCTPRAAITAHRPPLRLPDLAGVLLLATGASKIRVEGCQVKSATESVLLAGSPVSDLVMTNNSLTGLVLLATLGDPRSSQRLAITHNVVTGGTEPSQNAGIQLTNAKGVTVSDNSFSGLIHGAMWWGGDSAAPAATVQQVKDAGDMVFLHNHCTRIGGACLWGSMGFDIVMRGNTADGCGDICFDVEGGLRTQIVDNTATGCGNGCAGIFFFTDQTTISSNHFRAEAPGGGLIFIKNISQDPLRHDHLSIERNELVCSPLLCRAVYQEAAGGLRFAANEVTNGTWLPLGYARSLVIADNHFVYTHALPEGSAALSMPGLVGGTSLEVTGNRIESNATQPAAGVCLAGSWTDFNATDYHLIAANTCAGTQPFPIALRMVSEGKNPGVSAVWVLSANRFGTGSIQHLARTPNTRLFDLGECDASGCLRNETALNASRTISGCGGPSPSAALGTASICMGPVRGWTAVPIGR